MDILNNLDIKGDLVIQLFDETGNKYYESEHKNLVVTTGRQYIASRMKETGRPNEMTHMEIGQGTSTQVAGNTTIQTAFSPQARVSLSVAGGTVSGTQITYSATFPAGTGTGPVTEAGIFNNSAAGTMLSRTTFPVVNKQAADVMVISWTISIIAS